MSRIQVLTVYSSRKSQALLIFSAAAVLIANCGLGMADKMFISSGCPREFYNGIKPYGECTNECGSYATGYELNFECDKDDDDPQKRLSEEFFVYPTPTRSCELNGTWSGIPPVCVKKQSISYFQSNGRNVTPRISRFCNTCQKELQNWSPIGNLHESCLESATVSNDMFEQMKVYFEFSRHVHLSFMTFSPPSDKLRGLNVKLLVPPEKVIKKFSQESTRYLRNDYATFFKQKRGTEHECAIVEIAAFTDRLLAVFSLGKSNSSHKEINVESIKNIWKPRAFFFPVEESNLKDRREWFGNGCPEVPVIPNGIIKQVSKDNETVTYVCESGYFMLDPATKHISNGELSCHKGYEWTPYPLPICVSLDLADETAPNKLNDYLFHILIVIFFILGLILGSVVAYVCVQSRKSHLVQSAGNDQVCAKKRQNSRPIAYINAQRKENCLFPSFIPRTEQAALTGSGHDYEIVV